ncbi:MAG: PHP-associated domain-containing protein [Anaerolineae bacterium]|nr:PHP domain-containing protein [Caldilineales bacterium]MCX7851201.1 PHP domain-containing protein [Caldilineales bacterium]MDW8267560.1 PHP-associated domain-containing protein [Anaerolineae bacterium]
MGLADLHIHSVHSDGTATVAAILHHASEFTDLDVIAVTDHDTLTGALQACEMAPRFRVQVIPGMEITTREGHLLALFLETPVQPWQSFVETAEQVRLRGGLPFAAHPTCSLGKSIGKARLRRIAQRYPGLLAGIEAENGALATLQDNAAAQDLRWELNLPALGNSDAHSLTLIGCAATVFPGHTAADLRRALEAGAVVPLPVRRGDGYFRHMAWRFALRLGMGLVEGFEGREGTDGRPRRMWVRAI